MNYNFPPGANETKKRPRKEAARRFYKSLI